MITPIRHVQCFILILLVVSVFLSFFMFLLNQYEKFRQDKISSYISHKRILQDKLFISYILSTQYVCDRFKLKSLIQSNKFIV